MAEETASMVAVQDLAEKDLGMNTIEIGDCRDIMKRWISEGLKVQMCVTSPPYWGLRDYGVDGQMGLEKTPEEYVSKMVEVFRLVRDLLVDDGTLWLNLGDSYVHDRFSSPMRGDYMGKDGLYQRRDDPVGIQPKKTQATGLKTKDICGIPWRVAFALQSDGWYLRQDIIWNKPNPMPESVTDRCTKAHEYLFLLSKSERYYFNQDAIREPYAESSIGRYRYSIMSNPKEICGGGRVNNAKNTPGLKRIISEGRNARSVWTIATEAYPEAHFATFPTKLVEPCILAGSMPGDIVLDPFMGSGTTAYVAKELGRKYLGCELNPNYEPLQAKRLSQEVFDFR